MLETNIKSTDLKLTQNSYYAASANEQPVYPKLQGDIEADVCVVGGGFAGLSAAIELADRGYSVVVLEANHIGFGASGRNGGQIIAGLACEQNVIENALGFEAAKQVWGMTLEALEIFQWKLAFVRRPLFQAPIPVLFDRDHTRHVVIQEDGTLDESQSLVLRA